MLASKERNSTIMRAVIIVLTLIFLYMPIGILVAYSFNESRMVTVWTEFSLKWYKELFQDAAIIKAVGISLFVAFFTACTSVVIGTLAAFVLVRVGRFKGESLFVLLMTAPMVLPEVITGLALLLIFVTLGSQFEFFANRGVWAIWIAHVTFTSAYTTVVIRSRFRELDVSIEEAAMDLGAGPIKVFFAVILPALMPSEVAAFLLAFTMSMDDLVVTSFIAGPDATTLPMLIFSSVRRGLSPEINALATIIVFIVSIFTFFAWLSMVKSQKRKKADAAKAARAEAVEQNTHFMAPHGNESIDPAKKLSDNEMKLLMEQVNALKEGRDIANEVAQKLKSLPEAKRHVAADKMEVSDIDDDETNDETESDKSNEVELDPGVVELEGDGQDWADLARKARKASLDAYRANVEAETREKTNEAMISALGESARTTTAVTRLASTDVAEAGKAKVVDLESKDSKEDTVAHQKAHQFAKDQAQKESAAATKEAAEVMISSGSNTVSSTTKNSISTIANMAGIGGNNKANQAAPKQATTTSSLEDAKAKKAALKSAMNQAIEQQSKVTDNNSLESSSLQSATGGQATTASSLALKKTNKAPSDTFSAKDITKATTDQAKSLTDKAKVVDTTKK